LELIYKNECNIYNIIFILLQLLLFVIDTVIIIINLIDKSSYEYILLDLNYIIKYPNIIYYFIISLSNNINYINKNNFSLLSFIILNKYDINIIKYILTNGAKVSTYDINIIQDNYLELYKEFIYNGYNINTKSETKLGGYTTFMLILSRYNKYYRNKLINIKKINDLDELIFFIINNTDINLNLTDNEGYNCLMYVTDINLFNYLIKKGANYKIKNKYDQSLLTAYIINENYKMANVVSNLFDTKEKDIYNKSAIQYALEKIYSTTNYNTIITIINIFNDKDKEFIVKNISHKLLNYDNDHIIKII